MVGSKANATSFTQPSQHSRSLGVNFAGRNAFAWRDLKTYNNNAFDTCDVLRIFEAILRKMSDLCTDRIRLLERSEMSDASLSCMSDTTLSDFAKLLMACS